MKKAKFKYTKNYSIRRMKAESEILKKIHHDLEFVKKEVTDIREHMIDVDAILSKDEELLLIRAREEYKKGETTPLEELEKDLGK